ncbi:MAG: hypothetical protein JXB15_04410 [Anaerolineales bacterium]|nr:hypothetical protein [Anaerolineales bacterium]
MIQKSGTGFKRTRPTYAFLRMVSYYALQLAQRPGEESNRFSNCMTSMVFSAFCLEAYLNHLGKDRISLWDAFEKLAPNEKLDELAKALKFRPDFGQRPYQTFRAIFKLRNLLVHAKTETLYQDGEFVLEPGEPNFSPIARWETEISIERATRFLDDTKVIVCDLSERAGLSIDEIFAAEIVEINETRTVFHHIEGYSSS